MPDPEPQPVRKRMARWESTDDARFLTFSCYRRLPLLSNPAIRDVFVRHLVETRAAYRIRILAWVVMPEHVHLLLRPAANETSLVRPLWFLKREAARTVLARWRELEAPILTRLRARDGRPRFWHRGGGYDRNPRDDTELEEKVAYIHANPVRRGLVERPTDWAWSSARWYRGDRTGPVPIDRLGREFSFPPGWTPFRRNPNDDGTSAPR